MRRGRGRTELRGRVRRTRNDAVARGATVPILGALLLAAGPAGGRLHGQSANGGGAATEPRSTRTTPVLLAAPAGGPVRVDGLLDEPAWHQAPEAGDFVQLRPDEGSPASEATTVRVLAAGDALYVGALLSDRSPAEIAARLGRRDDDVQADWFYVYVDGYRDRRTAFGFGVSAAGVQRDLRISDDAQEDASWDAVWEAEVRLTSDGWVAEMRIPLSQLRFTDSDAGGAWGLNFARVLARRNETSHWSPVPQGSPSFVSLFGELVGVSGLEPGRRVEVVPYTVARLSRAPVRDGDPFRGATEGSTAVGADVRVGLGSSMTLSATLNPDFGQIEGDPDVLNLSAFEVFQQERRPFFVEGADIFSLAAPRWPPLFYSRRIGRTPQGSAPAEAEFVDRPSATTILGAVKLSGKTESGWSIGLMEAVTPRETARYATADGRVGARGVEPATHYAVARVARELREGRTGIGLLATAVNRSIDDPELTFLRDAAYVLALDGRHRFAGDAWEARAGVQASQVRGDTLAIRLTQTAPGHYYQRPDAGHVSLDPRRTSLSGWSADASVQRLRGSWKGGVSTRATSPGFEVGDLGFNPTLDHAMTYAWVRREDYSPGRVFRRWGAGASAMTQSNMEGQRQELTQDAGFDFQLLNYWGGNVWVMRHAPAWTPTHLRGGPSLRKPGRWMGSFGIDSDPRRSVTGNAFLFWEVEDETDGRQLNASASVTVRPSDRVTVRAGPTFGLGRDAWQYVGEREVAGAPRMLVGALNRRTLSLSTRLDYTLSPELSFQAYVRPFVATVRYDAFREVAHARARSFADRFLEYGVTRTERDGSDLLALDRDGDGAPDAEITDPSFASTSVQLNAVLRWEYRPGSTLFLVWTHDRDHFGQDRFSVGPNLDDLWRAPARNVLMVKASYWLGG